MASKQQTTALFLSTIVTRTRRHTELTKVLTNLMGNRYCAREHSVQFHTHKKHTELTKNLTNLMENRYCAREHSVQFHTHKKTHRTDKKPDRKPVLCQRTFSSVSHAQKHTELTKNLTNLMENMCCAREHSVQFHTHKKHTELIQKPDKPNGKPVLCQRTFSSVSHAQENTQN